MSLRVYQELPERFKAASDPETLVSLLRGDKIGQEVTGIKSILDPNLAEQVVYDSLQPHAYPPIRTLVSRHVQGNNYDSPFISLTNRLKIAEDFSQASDEVIYQLAIPAFRLIVDPIWAKAPEGTMPEEYLVIGRIEPSDITGIVTR